VKFVFKQNPLPMHNNAMIAAEAALAANAQGKFWQMHDKLFQNTRALAREDLERYAQEIGLDMARFKRSLDTHEFQREIQADAALAAQLGARGTPSFFINGRPLRGAQPFEGFKTVIDEELQRAERLVKTGVPRARLYAELTKGGLTKAAPPSAGGPEGATKRPPPRPREDPNAVYKVAVSAEDPQRGPDTALVTIVEWTDFQ
jgi:protein-disulfide isomerase